MQILKHLFFLGIFAVAGLFVGFYLGTEVSAPVETEVKEREIPLPHQVSRRKDGLSLRFAMVHDVLLERYPRHSSEWYRRRNSNVRTQLNRLKKNHPDALPRSAFDLYDDLGVGLARLERYDEAVKVLREKWDRQKKQNITGKPLYSTYANLGTILVHKHMRDALAGNSAARDAVRTGLSHIRKAIKVNPDAHFGREKWQAVAVEFLLEATEQPELMKNYDMVGNDLNVTMDDLIEHSTDPYVVTSALVHRREYIREYKRVPAAQLLNPEGEAERKRIRSFIRPIQPDPEWREATGVDLPDRIPFDRPVLGIVGMWRIGGGPNPHFALALGEIMFRVGQRRLAWEAYERAIRMKRQFPADHGIRKRLVEHCRTRQKHIEQDLEDTGRRELLSTFESELQHALDWRTRYQEFEKRRLNAGHELKDESFHEPFFEKHGSISTEPGNADRLRVVERYHNTRAPRWPLALGLFGAGLFSLLYGWSVYRKA